MRRLLKVAGGLAALLLLTAQAPAPTSLHFEDGTRASGINFQHHPSRTSRRLMPEIMGSGVVLADFNRDGALDVLLIDSGRLGKGSRPVGAENRLYINDGAGRFTDRSADWDLPSPGYGMGATAGDFDNDGYIDLYLTTYDGPDTLLRNTGAQFLDATEAAGILQDGLWSTSAGFFDLEGDGDLDLWVVRYLHHETDDALPCYFNRLQVYCTPLLFDGLPGRLLRNDGDGTFTDLSSAVAAQTGKGLGLTLGDIDHDGDTDIYVAHDTTPNHLWLNDGQGKLLENGLLAGVALSELGAELAGMGTAMADADGDGRMDLAVTNFQGETTTLYLQGEHGMFREVSDAIGIGQAAREKLKFGIVFADADNDGDEDLMVANGHLYDNVAQFSSTASFEQDNTLYERLEDGRFRDVSESAGPGFSDRQVSRGLATGDLDGDGDLDFLVANNGGRAQVGVNASVGAGNFVNLWLEGRSSNRSAIGARVEARIGDRRLVRQVLGAGSYLSASDLRVHLGLASASAIDELTIHWPGSEPQVIRQLPAGRFYRIVQGSSPVPYTPGEAVIPP